MEAPTPGVAINERGPTGVTTAQSEQGPPPVALTIFLTEQGQLGVTAPQNNVTAFGLLFMGAVLMVGNMFQPARIVAPPGPVPKGEGFLAGLRRNRVGK